MKNSQIFQSDVLIVGAGLAGLMAANWLQDNGRSVIVVEKAAHVGGRMATMTIRNGRGDSGAQFFTVRDPIFQTIVAQWIAAGLVFEWSKGWSDGSLLSTKPDGFLRYAVTNGMTAVPQTLANKITIHNKTKIITLVHQAEQWQLTAQNSNQYHSAALILTAPVPQSLTLLKAGNISLSDSDRAQLERIQYAPCCSALVAVAGDVTIPAPGALQRPTAIVSWMADNRQKGISKESCLITMHINPEKSKTWFLAPANEIAGVFRQELRPFLSKNSTIQTIKTQRWRYALPTTTHPEHTLLAQNLPPLAFAGDAFNGPRIEGAVLSGLAAAKAIL